MNNIATSYKIRGIAPPDLAGQPDSVKKMYWQWVVDFGLKRKDKELAAGLDKDGKPLRPILPETRKHRRSAMTPSGKGDPNAPPLTPGYQKSRTRSLLAGRPLTTHADFFWRFDPFTGDSWGVVLAAQAKMGRDVFGLSPAGTRWVQRQALAKWEAWKAQHRPIHPEVTATRAPAARKPPLPAAGRPTTEHAVFGIGATGPEVFREGRWSGAMTWPERQAYLRQSASAAIPGRQGPFNRLLGFLWGVKPKAKPKKREAMK